MSATGLSYTMTMMFPGECLRKVTFSGNSTLADIHTFILKELGFLDTAHLHAFYMDNLPWNPESEILGAEGTCGGIATGHDDAKVTLSSLDLPIGYEFLYIFDFTEGWMVHCKIEDVLEKKTDVPVTLFRSGEPPEQYPDYDNFYRQIVENPNYPELAFRLWRQHIHILEYFLDIDVVNVDETVTRWAIIPQVPIQTRGVMTHRYSNFVLRYLLRKYRFNLIALRTDFLTHRMETDAFRENRERKFPGMSDEEIMSKFIEAKNRLLTEYGILINSIKNQLKPE